QRVLNVVCDQLAQPIGPGQDIQRTHHLEAQSQMHFRMIAHGGEEKIHTLVAVSVQQAGLQLDKQHALPKTFGNNELAWQPSDIARAVYLKGKRNNALVADNVTVRTYPNQD